MVTSWNRDLPSENQAHARFDQRNGNSFKYSSSDFVLSSILSPDGESYD